MKCIIHEELTATDTEWYICEDCHAVSRIMEEEYFRQNLIRKIDLGYILQ